MSFLMLLKLLAGPDIYLNVCDIQTLQVYTNDSAHRVQVRLRYRQDPLTLQLTPSTTASIAAAIAARCTFREAR